MQVFRLPGHLIRNAGRASRLLGAKTPTIEAERRRDAVARDAQVAEGSLSLLIALLQLRPKPVAARARIVHGRLLAEV